MRSHRVAGIVFLAGLLGVACAEGLATTGGEDGADGGAPQGGEGGALDATLGNDTGGGSTGGPDGGALIEDASAPDGGGAGARDAGADGSDSGARDAGADGSDASDAGRAGDASDAGSAADASDAGSAADASDAGSAPLPTQGEVLITEIMYNPSGVEPDDEWFEVTNVAATARALSGLTIQDGSGRTHVIQSPGGVPVVVAPGAFVVLARLRASAVAVQVPAASIVYEYGAGLGPSSGVLLANGATGGVLLVSGATVIAQVPYGGWYTAPGASIQMSLPYTFAAGSVKASFCVSTHAFAAGSDLGTPGAASDCGM